MKMSYTSRDAVHFSLTDEEKEHLGANVSARMTDDCLEIHGSPTGLKIIPQPDKRDSEGHPWRVQFGRNRISMPESMPLFSRRLVEYEMCYPSAMRISLEDVRSAASEETGRATMFRKATPAEVRTIFEHLTEHFHLVPGEKDEKGRAVGVFDKGWSDEKIARETGTSKNSVSHYRLEAYGAYWRPSREEAVPDQRISSRLERLEKIVEHLCSELGVTAPEMSQ